MAKKAQPTYREAANLDAPIIRRRLHRQPRTKQQPSLTSVILQEQLDCSFGLVRGFGPLKVILFYLFLFVLVALTALLWGWKLRGHLPSVSVCWREVPGAIFFICCLDLSQFYLEILTKPTSFMHVDLLWAVLQQSKYLLAVCFATDRCHNSCFLLDFNSSHWRHAAAYWQWSRLTSRFKKPWPLLSFRLCDSYRLISVCIVCVFPSLRLPRWKINWRAWNLAVRNHTCADIWAWYQATSMNPEKSLRMRIPCWWVHCWDILADMIQGLASPWNGIVFARGYSA